MEDVFSRFETAHRNADGYLLASTLSPVAPAADPGFLYSVARSSNVNAITADVRYATVYNSNLGLAKAEATAWLDVYVAYWTAVTAMLAADEASNRGQSADAAVGHANAIYDAWKEVVNALIRGYSGAASFDAWTVPCMYSAGKYLRLFAIKADEVGAKARGEGAFSTAGDATGLQDDVADAAGENDKLEDAARVINRMFTICLSDRNPIENSRKWAIYYISNLLFKTYFKLNSISLTKNILRSLQMSADTPPLTAFPKAHQATFHYYHGVVMFLSEDYVAAEAALSSALRLCPSTSSSLAAAKNRDLILTYLIPCRLLTSRTLPSGRLLSAHPRLSRLFSPLCSSIREGNLAGFDKALVSGEADFVKRRIYLTLERGRDVALRNLFRKVVKAAGWEEGHEGKVRKSRISVDEFAAGLRVGLAGSEEQELERDEVECYIANCIYKASPVAPQTLARVPRSMHIARTTS